MFTIATNFCNATMHLKKKKFKKEKKFANTLDEKYPTVLCPQLICISVIQTKNKPCVVSSCSHTAFNILTL